MGNKYFSSQQFQNGIAFAFKPQHMGQVVTIIDNNQEQFFSYYDLSNAKGSLNAQLVELYCFSIIETSIPEAAPPVLNREDGEYINIQKTNDWLWKTSRLELELYSKSTFGSWVMFGIIPIKHNAGFRYRRNRVLDMVTDNVQGLLGRGDALGMRLVNAGYGNLTLPDQINIKGGWVQEPIVIQEHLPYVNNTLNVTGSSSSPSPSPTPAPAPVETINEFEITLNTSTQILAARDKRTALTITVVNAGNSGGTVFTYSSTGAVNASPFFDFYSSETGKIITGLNDWKGAVGANQTGFGDPGDAVTLKVTETYTL